MRSLPCFTSDLCWRNVVLKNGLFKRGLVEQPPHIQPVWVLGNTENQPYNIPLPWVYYDIQQHLNLTLVRYYASTPAALRGISLISIRCLYFSPTRLTRADQATKALSLAPLPNIDFLTEFGCYPRGISIPAQYGLPDYMTPQAWKPLTEEQRVARIRRLLTVDCHRLVEQQIIKWWDARFNMAYRYFHRSPLLSKVAPGGTRSTSLTDIFRMWEKVSLEKMLTFSYPRDAKYVVPALTRSCFDEYGQRRARYTHVVRVEGKTKAKKAKGHA